jgi:hypothetical protein
LTVGGYVVTKQDDVRGLRCQCIRIRNPVEGQRERQRQCQNKSAPFHIQICRPAIYLRPEKPKFNTMNLRFRPRFKAEGPSEFDG